MQSATRRDWGKYISRVVCWPETRVCGRKGNLRVFCWRLQAAGSYPTTATLSLIVCPPTFPSHSPSLKESQLGLLPGKKRLPFSVRVWRTFFWVFSVLWGFCCFPVVVAVRISLRALVSLKARRKYVLYSPILSVVRYEHGSISSDDHDDDCKLV